ncbi:MAG TPA: CPBP family intramembrane glutamic endopeptidase [Ramlibacter sp.]|uniref:CPBP family intramembrane glutamic endopeptidase n=1 Tax=Ramlibacter sp. TaxID=1917967 RepID=UPI002ED2447E
MEALRARTVATPLEAFTVMAICFGLPIHASVWAMLNGFPTGSGAFSDASFVRLIGHELLTAFVALFYLRVRGWDVASLRPLPTAAGVGMGVVLYVAMWVLGAMLVSPFETEAAEQPIQRMVQEAKLSLPMIVLTAVVNGTFEEVFLLGFLLRGLRAHGLSIALGAMLLVRVLYHLYQGPIGALWVLVFGLVVGLYYIASGKLWPAVVAHILGDIVPFLWN